MAHKNALPPGGCRGAGGQQINSKDIVIIAQAAQRLKLNNLLSQAHAAGDWKMWWRCYCKLHQIPWPPTGLRVKLAATREADNYAQLQLNREQG